MSDRLPASPPIYVGADLGGTNFRVGARCEGETALLDQESVPASGEWDGSAVAEGFSELVGRLRARSFPRGVIRGIGFALTGDIDPSAGICYSMKRFPGLEAFPLAALLRERLGAPVSLLNDGLAAALAELRAGAGRDVRSFVMITLGTGIGGGIVLDGRLLAGERGRIGKVGHQIIDLDGPVHCHCGLPGCWQSLAGRDGVTARAAAMTRQRPGSGLARALAAVGSFDLQRLAELAHQGDAAAREVLDETGRYVGIGLANLVKIFAPERVIVGGGIAERNALLLHAIARTVDEYAIKPYQHVPVVPARFGKNAGVLGATFLAEEGPPV